MRRSSLVFLVSLFFANMAFAQATRTWVSGVGDDANPCSRTAPCKTFAGAISKTQVAGEIDVLDPGGFGALTITKSITLDGGGGQVASILVTGTNAINVSAGVNDTVTLRNLDFNGVGPAGNAGLNGIRITSAKNVHVEHCAIFGFSARGISIETSSAVKVLVRDSVIRNNGEGIGSVPGGATVQLAVENTSVDQNGGQGLNITYSTSVSAVGSHFNFNGASGMIVWAGTSSASLDRCELNGNQYGIYAGYMGGNPTIDISHSLITGNSVSGLFLNGGTVVGHQNNVIVGNVGNNLVSMSQAQQ